jgi:hypothetical protein
MQNLLLQAAEPAESGAGYINLVGILTFLGLAVISATIILLIGKALFKKWHSFFLLLVYSLLGGLLAAAILLFGVKFEQVRAQNDLDSLGTLLMMGCGLFLVMMIAWPVMGLVLRDRKRRIKLLEEENNRLKNSDTVFNG